MPLTYTSSYMTIPVIGGTPAAVTEVTIDASATAAIAASQSISLNMTVGPTANAMLIAQHFSYSGHGGYSLTWTVGATTQTFQVTNNFDFIMTSDNGPTAPATAVIGLLNPTPGSGTLSSSFSGTADDMILEAISFKNVNTLGGLSGAFTAAQFTTGTSASATMVLPANPKGIQCVFAGVVSSSFSTWNTGTQLYNLSSGGITQATGVYKRATAATTFSASIGASVFWAIAGVTVNFNNVFSATPILDNTNALTSSLAFAIPCLAAGTLTDLVTSHTASTAGGITTDTSGGYGGGISVPGASTTAKADFGVWQPIASGDFTIIALANPTNGSNQGALIGQCDSGAANFIDLLTNSNITGSGLAGQMSGGTFNGSTTQGVQDRNPPSVANGSIHVDFINGGYHCWASRVASGVPTLWCDGRNVTDTTVNVTGTITNVNQHFAIGNLGNYTASAFSAGCTIVLVLGFSSALSDANVGSITSNPFQVLK